MTTKANIKHPEPNRQFNLFDRYHQNEPHHIPTDPTPKTEPLQVKKISDDAIVAMLPQATLSNIEQLCSEIVRRSLISSIPALYDLWNRFIGFGITKPLLEQVEVIKTLGLLESPDAGSMLKKIILSDDLSTGLRPEALQAAAQHNLRLPKEFITPHLTSDELPVRILAFELAAYSMISSDLLQAGLIDAFPEVRLAAAISMGEHGYSAAKNHLINELKQNPCMKVIDAIVGIADDDIIVHLGRLAIANSAYRKEILEHLKDMECPKADKIINHLNSSI